MVLVCDALCGFGKTSAMIRMMNEDGEHRFIFVTQFLSEVDRILRSCPDRDFAAPDTSEGTKLSSLNALLSAGRNIATTHSLFIGCSKETKRLIREGNYILILDEVIDVMNIYSIDNKDIELLERAGALKEENGIFTWSSSDFNYEDYKGKFFEEAYMARSQRLEKFDGEYYFWSIPKDLFTSFEQIYVLTYMFYAQPLRCFFDIKGIDYGYIGVRKGDDGGYYICPATEMDRRVDLRDKIRILDHPRMNSVGDKRSSLSHTWYTTINSSERKERIDRIRKNLVNLSRNIFKAKTDDFMWTVYKTSVPELKVNGINSSFVVYNKRACNEYAGRHYLAYCVNNFPRPWEMRYYNSHGAELDADMYGLSILVQWIFRSAIRRGEPIHIYIPSVRMRTLLKMWMENLARGDDLTPVHYSIPKKDGARGRRKEIKDEEM